MGFLDGSNSSQSGSSSNVNNNLLKTDFSGTIGNGQQANNFLTSLLTGTGNTAAANNGYQNYLQNAGYGSAMKQLSQNITGQGAASGLLNSGSTSKALVNYGGQLNNQFFNNYLQSLSGLSQQGLGAGGILSSSGNVSNSSGGSQSGLFK